jgi:NifB/MoaA-like Fe-S oxidoreductase
MVTIVGVNPMGLAAKAGVLEGDILLAINGHKINDVLDYRFYLTDTALRLDLHRGPELLSVSIRKGEYDDIGLEFETPLMDKKHSCANGCVFCFIDQLPKGMRKSLYFKDDDDRLSFLHGNYVTLTNLHDEDIDRLIGFIKNQ